ncbi:DUF1573 domain-containing protein [Tunicatimonas pelagia]|uniref:DUF1573 domain-containing protein n=1 Tax=Tunicatimonas pelagia TaxID=931531 RepID=UPI00266677C0|nr:DUF1573 domain-containing protein [Tunicatimonas pelagia]WKN42453.1 DUF1573 domain-containing protein [Tunicatimonas pelagia]
MKFAFALLFSFVFIGSVVAQEEATTEDLAGPQITFAQDTKDFGDIIQGDKVSHSFEFENTGTEPLILSNVLTTCGCTATAWPREPIAPGESAKIEVSFNSTGKKGRQNKVVTVVSNAVNAQERVKLITNVLPNKDVQ